MSLSIRVKELLDEGTLNQIIAQVKKDLEGEWASSPPEAQSQRELIYHELHCLSKLETRMQAMINELYMAERRD